MQVFFFSTKIRYRKAEKKISERTTQAFQNAERFEQPQQAEDQAGKTPRKGFQVTEKTF